MSSRKRRSCSKNSPEPSKKKASETGVDEVTVEFDYNRNENTTRHHTDEYENNVLVLRRGATFDLGLIFNNVGPKEIQDSVLRFIMGTKRGMKMHTWDTKILKKDSNELTRNFQIEIPVRAAVGRYTIEVVLPKRSTQPLKQSGQIIVLFNPWNEEDEVYLAEEDLRNEYVLNDDGVIYAGWSQETGPNPDRWNFGQVC